MGNIVWLASYPKSGNTWLRAFIYNLIEQPKNSGRLDMLTDYFESESNPRWYLPLTDNGTLDDVPDEDIIAMKNEVHQRIATSKPRGSIFTKTHNRFGKFNNHPLHNVSVMAGAIYVVRNPLDVVLSSADHFGLSLDEAIEFMANEDTGTPSNMNNVISLLGSWSTHVHSWTHQSHDQVVVLRFEDMLDKPLKTFEKVAKLIGMAKDKKAIKQAIRFSSFTELKKQENRKGFTERSSNSKSFFRKGRKNQWVEVLSDEQVERIVERHREQMEYHGYIPPKYQ